MAKENKVIRYTFRRTIFCSKSHARISTLFTGSLNDDNLSLLSISKICTKRVKISEKINMTLMIASEYCDGQASDATFKMKVSLDNAYHVSTGRL